MLIHLGLHNVLEALMLQSEYTLNEFTSNDPQRQLPSIF